MPPVNLVRQDWPGVSLFPAGHRALLLSYQEPARTTLPEATPDQYQRQVAHRCCCCLSWAAHIIIVLSPHVSRDSNLQLVPSST